MTAELAYFASGLMATGAIALSRAMLRRPEPSGAFAKPLNALLTGALGGSAMILCLTSALVRFGLIIPAFFAVIFFAAYRLVTHRDLFSFYRFALPFSIVTLISTILAVTQTLTIRSIP